MGTHHVRKAKKGVGESGKTLDEVFKRVLPAEIALGLDEERRYCDPCGMVTIWTGPPGKKFCTGKCRYNPEGPCFGKK
ncbi:MAG: hypothetical protein ABIS26_01320 [Candidatus Paceibacterota bacterium]